MTTPSSTEPVEQRIARLRARPASTDESRIFFHEPRFNAIAVKVQPGEYFIDDEGLMLTTVLGSCVSVCLHDPVLKLGGMNHIMVPEGDEASGRYGLFAMEQLINAMVKRGASRARLQAKVFGGGSVIPGMAAGQIGARNVSFVDDFLQRERITVQSRDVLGNWPRKLNYFATDARAMVKKLATTQTQEQELERRLADRVRSVGARGGSVDLF